MVASLCVWRNKYWGWLLSSKLSKEKVLKSKLKTFSKVPSRFVRYLKRDSGFHAWNVRHRQTLTTASLIFITGSRIPFTPPFNGYLLAIAHDSRTCIPPLASSLYYINAVSRSRRTESRSKKGTGIWFELTVNDHFLVNWILTCTTSILRQRRTGKGIVLSHFTFQYNVKVWLQYFYASGMHVILADFKPPFVWNLLPFKYSKRSLFLLNACFLAPPSFVCKC